MSPLFNCERFPRQALTPHPPRPPSFPPLSHEPEYSGASAPFNSPSDLPVFLLQFLFQSIGLRSLWHSYEMATFCAGPHVFLFRVFLLHGIVDPLLFPPWHISSQHISLPIYSSPGSSVSNPIPLSCSPFRQITLFPLGRLLRIYPVAALSFLSPRHAPPVPTFPFRNPSSCPSRADGSNLLPLLIGFCWGVSRSF